MTETIAITCTDRGRHGHLDITELRLRDGIVSESTTRRAKAPWAANSTLEVDGEKSVAPATYLASRTPSSEQKPSRAKAALAVRVVRVHSVTDPGSAHIVPPVTNRYQM